MHLILKRQVWLTETFVSVSMYLVGLYLKSQCEIKFKANITRSLCPFENKGSHFLKFLRVNSNFQSAVCMHTHTCTKNKTMCGLLLIHLCVRVFVCVWLYNRKNDSFYHRISIVSSILSNPIHLEVVEHLLLLLTGNIMQIC